MLIPKLAEKAIMIFKKQQVFWINDSKKRDMFNVLDFPLKRGSRDDWRMFSEEVMGMLITKSMLWGVP